MPHVFPDLLPFHNDSICSECTASPIYGSLYQCNTCSNYTICEECMQNNISDHPSNHTMKMKLSLLDENALDLHNEIPCSICKTEKYPGVQYCCDDENLVYCERCFPSDYDQKFEEKIVEAQKHYPLLAWKARCIKLHSGFGKTLGSRPYDEIDVTKQEEQVVLARKIGYAIFGPPQQMPDEKSAYGYSIKEEKNILKLVKYFVKLHKKIKTPKLLFNTIFISMWCQDYSTMIPIFRIHSCNFKNEFYFVESSGRTYKTWEKFMKDNKLPKSNICFPHYGKYKVDEHGFSNIEFVLSREYSTSRKLVKMGDETSGILGIGGTVVALAGMMLTPLGPLTAAGATVAVSATAVYGTVRSIFSLKDRRGHNESINPFTNKESFFAWLSIAGSAFALGSTSSAMYLTKMGIAGNHVNKTMRVLSNTAIFGSLGINGVNIVCNTVNIAEKYKNGNITSLDIFQLTASLIFFTNSVVSLQTASGMIKNAQKQTLDNLRSEMTDDTQRLNFDREILIDRQNAKGKTGEMHGAEATIKKINDLKQQNSNWQENFGRSVDPSSSAGKHTAQPTHLINGKDYVLSEDAILLAQTVHETRNKQNQNPQSTKNTIFAVPPHELDTLLKQEAQNQGIAQGEIKLPGKFFAHEVEINSKGIPVSNKPVEIQNPTFTFDGEKGVHYFPKNDVKTYLNEMPNPQKIEVILTHSSTTKIYPNPVSNRSKSRRLKQNSNISLKENTDISKPKSDTVTPEKKREKVMRPNSDIIIHKNLCGNVLWFDIAKMYGFIVADGADPKSKTDRIFVHRSGIIRTNEMCSDFIFLRNGEMVKFDVVLQANGKRKAVNVCSVKNKISNKNNQK